EIGGKVAAALRQGGHVRDQHAPDQLARALEIPEEERVIFFDGAAYDKAILIAAENRLVWIVSRSWCEQIAGIQDFVAQELKRGTVQIIRARLGGQIDHAAIEAPEFGGRRVDLQLEFLNRVNHRVKGDLPRFRL